MLTRNRDTLESNILRVFLANHGAQTNCYSSNFVLFYKLMVNISDTLVTLFYMLMHHEALTVKICMYPRNSWGKPTFDEFGIT